MMFVKSGLMSLLLVGIVISVESLETETGICSYYTGSGTTASGEAYNERALTAAHPTWPFGTRVGVFNARGNGVTVVINDRGPFVHGRILDLSKRAAEKLGIIEVGLERHCKIVRLT
ncbi:probable endolytic peptidoglycan transglycosylase RlpA [Aphidius gifuensis]|uniref:probable endolytic peptidoglycan transglycosylase RlpA n=1 Tax=Aphidius gifuensis TaxID=684658 RepID=UPI001CDCBC68|nr:probable endolytic peptidoglycan transglycosylase RlpA [Aphidius gifuensis]